MFKMTIVIALIAALYAGSLANAQSKQSKDTWWNTSKSVLVVQRQVQPSRELTALERQLETAIGRLPTIATEREFTIRYKDIRETLRARPEVQAMEGFPETRDIMGIWPDWHDDSGKITPILNVFTCIRKDFSSNSYYAIVRAAVKPDIDQSGNLAFELFRSEITDLRVNDTSILPWKSAFRDAFKEKVPEGLKIAVERGLAELHDGFAREKRKRIRELLRQNGIEDDEVLNKLDEMVGVRQVSIEQGGIRIQLYLTAYGSFISGAFGYINIGPTGWLGAEAPNESAAKKSAVLVVDLYHDHLQYYYATQLYREHTLGLDASDDWEINNGHRKLDGWLAETGKWGVKVPKAERDPSKFTTRVRPGSRMVRLYLKDGDSFPDLARLAVPLDESNATTWQQPWRDAIGTIIVRPGPAYDGHKLACYDYLDFDKDKGDDFEPLILEPGYHNLRHEEAYRFGKNNRTQAFHQIASMKVITPKKSNH